MVIAISIFHNVSLSELWIEFGTGKNLRFIPVHEISAKHGKEKCNDCSSMHLVGAIQHLQYQAKKKKHFKKPG